MQEPKCVRRRQRTPLYESTPDHGTLCEHIGDRNLAHRHPGPVGLELRPLLLSPGPYKLSYSLKNISIKHP